MSVEKLSVIWPDWKVVKQLGEGAFGKVYQVIREGHGVTSNAAVKVISIPQSDAELSSIRSEGLDERGTRSYFEGIVTDFVNEIKLMESMKGTSNIVSVEDYYVLEKTDKIGWDIFIRMELLTPLNDYLANKPLTEPEVIKLGHDICSALELCARRKIIHRDIKPENIFVSSFGDFKVGDFGIARELEKTSGSLSQKGTYNYMAPEIPNSGRYDATVDIYSLGLVLYKLLNNNRLPFLDPHAQLIKYADRKNAIDRRFSGEALPAPINASADLAGIVLMACAFNPAERFLTPTAFKSALASVKESSSGSSRVNYTAPPVIHPRPEIYEAPVTNRPTVAHTGLFDVPTESFGQKRKSGSKKFATAIVVSVVVVLLIIGTATGVYFIIQNGIFDGFGSDPDTVAGAGAEAREYDFVIASGGGYRIVARSWRNSDDGSDMVGVTDDDGNWIHPLSADHPLITGGRIRQRTNTAIIANLRDFPPEQQVALQDNVRQTAIRQSYRHYEGSVFSAVRMVMRGATVTPNHVEMHTEQYFDARTNTLIPSD